MAWVWMTQVAFPGMGVGVSLGLHGLTTFLSLSLSFSFSLSDLGNFPLFRWFQPLFKDLTTTQLAAEVSICPRFYRPIQPLPCQEIISNMGLPVNRVPQTDWTIWSLLFNIVNANFIRIYRYMTCSESRNTQKKQVLQSNSSWLHVIISLYTFPLKSWLHRNLLVNSLAIQAEARRCLENALLGARKSFWRHWITLFFMWDMIHSCQELDNIVHIYIYICVCVYVCMYVCRYI